MIDQIKKRLGIKPKLLLHVCCVGCGAYVSKILQKKYKVIFFFYNPNIYPEKEYNIRLDEAKRLAKKLKVKLMIEEKSYQKWKNSVIGYEDEPERGKRCLICFRDRLDHTAYFAREKKIKHFCTTLTISPHKNADDINRIGKAMAQKYKLNFLEKDFKKEDGFKKSCQLSKDLELYRQDYCGCEFSIRK